MVLSERSPAFIVAHPWQSESGQSEFRGVFLDVGTVPVPTPEGHEEGRGGVGAAVGADVGVGVVRQALAQFCCASVVKSEQTQSAQSPARPEQASHPSSPLWKLPLLHDGGGGVGRGAPPSGVAVGVAVGAAVGAAVVPAAHVPVQSPPSPRVNEKVERHVKLQHTARAK